LLNRLAHIAGLGNVRQVNLGLELLCLYSRARAAATAAGLGMLGKIPLNTLRLVHFY
jgi:hypothetical protein